MSVLDWFKPRPKPRVVHVPVPVRAAYDVVRQTPENVRHWLNIDYSSPDSSLEPEEREKIRAQARYECQENNAYGKGMALTYSSDVVGTGPRLQMALEDEDLNLYIQREFGYWMECVDLTTKLTTLFMARMVDGESVARVISNPSSDYPVQLDLQTFEADYLQAPGLNDRVTPMYVDGVHLDVFGNPIKYDLLKEHPGDKYLVNYTDYFTYDKSEIIHLFRCDRAGQHRGVSEFAAALPLFAFLRRFTLATVAAAETAASVSQVISTDAPLPEDLSDDLREEMYAQQFEKIMEDSINIDRNSATVLPNQWKLQQFSPEHPTTTYKMFKHEILAEIGRVVGMPKNVALQDASESNYASGRMDHLPYRKKVLGEQKVLNKKVMDRLLSEWLIEASLLGLLPKRVGNQILSLRDAYGTSQVSKRVIHEWHWDGFEDADIKDVSDAQRVRLQNGTTNRAREYAAQGLDVDIEDMKAAGSFGMTVDEYRQLCVMSIFTNGNQVNGQEPQPSSPTDTEQEDTSSS